MFNNLELPIKNFDEEFLKEMPLKAWPDAHHIICKEPSRIRPLIGFGNVQDVIVVPLKRNFGNLVIVEIPAGIYILQSSKLALLEIFSTGPKYLTNKELSLLEGLITGQFIPLLEMLDNLVYEKNFSLDKALYSIQTLISIMGN